MHPFHHVRETHAGRKRANEMAKGFKRGGAAHGDEAADRKLFKRMIKEHDEKVPGRASGGRLDKFARGGKTKHGTQVNIAVVAPHGRQGAAPAPGGILPPAGGGLPPKPPIAPPPPPPGAGAMPPPGMMKPPMKTGGRAYKHGGKVHMTAGAFSGVGRLEKARHHGKK